MRTACVAVLLAALALTACSEGENPAPGAVPTGVLGATTPVVTTPPGEPQTVEGARALAELRVKVFGASDYAGVWDMWTASAQSAFSRADYVRYYTECKDLAAGAPVTVTNVRLENPTTAVVTIDRLGFGATYSVVYEAGKWRWQPSADQMADYAKGVDVMIAEKRARGGCA